MWGKWNIRAKQCDSRIARTLGQFIAVKFWDTLNLQIEKI